VNDIVLEGTKSYIIKVIFLAAEATQRFSGHICTLHKLKKMIN